MTNEDLKILVMKAEVLADGIKNGANIMAQWIANKLAEESRDASGSQATPGPKSESN